MHFHEFGQRFCSTCNHWRGSRILDEGKFVCAMTDTAPCRRKNTHSAPEDSCQDWVAWDHIPHSTPHPENADCWEHTGCGFAVWGCTPHDIAHPENANCWEYTGCGFEAGGMNAAEHGICPAYPDRGRQCYTVNDTKCDLMRRNIPHVLAQTKQRGCQKCNFYHMLLPG